MKEIIGIVVGCLIVWLIFISLQAIGGIHDADLDGCTKNRAMHIEIIFPGYRAGCWLGQRFSY